MKSIGHCDVGQHIFNTLVYFYSSKIWTVLYKANDSIKSYVHLSVFHCQLGPDNGIYVGSPICYFCEKRILKLLSLSSCQYVSTIPGKKTACYRPFKNEHFLEVCTEKMMDHQYRENGAKNIYSNYNQMRAYVECSPNQFKKELYLIDLSIEQSTKL